MRKAIEHIKRADKKLGAIAERTPLKKIENKGSHFETLVESIISQQLSIKAADTIFSRFKKLFRGSKFPAPKDIIKIDLQKLRSVGLSGQKASYIKDLASKVLTKEVDLSTLEKLRDEEVIIHLTKVKGIGRWTAEMFLIFSLARPDVFSYGDLGLKNAMQKIYGLRKHPSPKKAAEISDKWKPHRSAGSRLLWASLNNKKD